MRTIKETRFGWIGRHRVGLGCFAFLVLYQWLIINNGSLWWVNPSTYALYALDYSMGFCSRILPGAVYGALVGKYDYRYMTVFVTVFFITLLGLASFFAEKLYAAAGQKEKKAALLLLFFFFTGPFTFGLFARAFGMLDFYWCFFFALSLLLLPKKRLKWSLPVFFVCMAFIHYAAILSYSAMLLLLILFFAAKTEDRKEKREYCALFAVCALPTVAITAYFILFDIENVNYSLEELDRILREERGALYPEYVEGALYRLTDPRFSREAVQAAPYTVDPDSTGLMRFFQWVVFFAWGALTYAHPYKRLLFPVLLELPAAVFLLALLFSYFRAKKGNRELRIVALLMILFFFGVSVVSILFAADNFRWMAHALTCLFICTFMVLYCDYREGFQKARAFFHRVGALSVAVYAVVYALTSMDPYV